MQSRGIKTNRRVVGMALAMALLLACLPGLSTGAQGKAVDLGETVENVLLYIVDSNGDYVLASQQSVESIYDYYIANEDIANEDDFPVYNYSVLDNFVTPVHQEARGFTVDEFIDYMAGRSSLSDIRDLGLAFGDDDGDLFSFWEMDDTAFDPEDTYTYADLYGEARYNFPAMYANWDYDTKAFKDKDAVWASKEIVPVILSIEAFSQRYSDTTEKVNGGDYNMECYWNDQGLLDTQRTVRILMGLTEDEFLNANTTSGTASTASNTRYWNCDFLLDTAKTRSYTARGSVSAPTYYIVDGDTTSGYADGYYYIYLEGEAGADLYYNHSGTFGYMPTGRYTAGEAIAIEKTASNETQMTTTGVKFRAVREGYTDAGIQVANLENAVPRLTASSYYGAGSVSIPMTYVHDVSDWARYATFTLNGQTLTGSQYTAAADANGQYSLNLSSALVSDAGSYTLTVTYLGQTQTVSFQVADTSQVTINTTPADAAVTVRDGDGQTVSPSAFHTYLLPDGNYTYTASAEGYADAGGSFTVSGADLVLSVQLSAGGEDDEPDVPIEERFSDIDPDGWYYDAVCFVVENGLFEGNADGTFAPEGTMTRAMFVTVLGRLAEIDQDDYPGTAFTDVPENEWFSAYVQWAAENDIVQGVGDGRFDPEGEVTRQEMATALCRYAVTEGIDTGVEDPDGLDRFSDGGDTADWAVEAVLWAVEAGVISGNADGTLAPLANAQRAHVAQLMKNVVESGVVQSA